MESATPPRFQQTTQNIELTEILPEEIWALIFRFIDHPPASLVCQEWYRLMEYRFEEMCTNMEETYVSETIGCSRSDLPEKGDNEDYHHYAYQLHQAIEGRLYFGYKENPKTNSLSAIEDQIKDQWCRDAEVCILC